ncbi:MAG: bluetail domain-containing putative surface protein [Cyanobacteriota bacterium]|nr:bluetail domain-containing putative surface protein [Cyanobacteriota bacterium]
MDGGTGNDNLVGVDNSDLMLGSDGDDNLSGGDDLDPLQGGSGNDKLYGDAGNDLLLGGIGNDLLEGVDGADPFTGSAGKERLMLRSLSESLLNDSGNTSDTITDYRNGDILDLPRARGSLSTSAGSVAALTAASLQSLFNVQLPSFSARAFQATGWRGTFLTINDRTPGFNANFDSILFLRDYNIFSASHPVVMV